ncbi:MAG: thioredoxin domain-containing protein [Bacteroidota bacterium]
MKNNLLLLLALCLSLQLATAQGIDFFKGDWEAALAQAQSQDKLIFVDAYATWCGPCKRMAAEVFPDEKVGAFYNRNFVSLKIDMEAPENAEFAAKYPVAAFPTLYYMDAEGEVIQSVKGAQKSDQFIRTGANALAQSEPSGDYAAEYEDGNRDPELVYKYVRSLIRNDEPHLRVANDFLRAQDDLNTPDNLQFIMLAATEADSRIFNLMIERKDAIISANSEDLYYSQVYAACQATVEKSVEYSSLELLKEACELMKEHNSEQAEEFQYVSEMSYAEAHRDGKMYAKAARSYAKEVIAEDAAKLNDFALRTSNVFDSDKNVLDVAQYAALEAIKYNSDTFRHYYTLAIVEKKRGNKKEALGAARKALVLAQENSPNAVRMLTAFIDTLEREG